MFQPLHLFKKIQQLSQFISWNLFLLIFGSIIIDDLASLLISDSKMFQFYMTMYAFEPLSAVWYVTNFLQVLINVLILIPFTLYIYNKHLPFRKLWLWILLAKPFFDISGHYYQLLDTKSLFYVKPIYGILAVIAQLIIWVPPYIASVHTIINNRRLEL